MVQRSYKITDFENGSFEKMVDEIKASDEYLNAGQVLVLIYEDNWDRKECVRKAGYIKENLPNSVISGTTHFEWDKVDAKISIFSFLFFDNESFCVNYYNLEGHLPEETGQRMNEDILALDDVRAVMIGISGARYNLEKILENAEKGLVDVDFFGASAATNFENPTGIMVGFVYDEERTYDNYLIAVTFYGKNLHVKVKYNFGWTPVGKQMEVTETEDDYTVVSIDNKPAVDIYRKYLGLNPLQIHMQNVCEFPLMVEGKEIKPVRIPVWALPNGSLMFLCTIKEGDLLRFTYGAHWRIFSEIEEDSNEIMDFDPEGILLFVCVNRKFLLKDDEYKETSYYKRTGVEYAELHGGSEIYRRNGEGGELNSALISVAFREGESSRQKKESAGENSGKAREKGFKKEALGEEFAKESGEGFGENFGGDEEGVEFGDLEGIRRIIPLEYRVMEFMSAITNDLEDAAKEAEAANEAKSRFLSLVSHEIRTPLNAILGLNDVIIDRTEEKDTRKNALDIKNAGNMLHTLINDILDLSKIESGKMELIPQEYEVMAMIRSLLKIISGKAKEKGLKIKTEISPDIPSVLYGDDIRVKQIFTNILTNAIKYTEEGSVTIRMKGKFDEDYFILHCEIEDTGIGIKEEDISKLFEAYQRIEEKRNRNVEGTGLGMSITMNLLNLMGSRLNVESEYGKGSKFYFDIRQKIVDETPIRVRKKTGGIADKKDEHRDEKIDARVLVVDDNMLNLNVFKAALEKTGVDIVMLESGEECVEICLKEKFDFIFLDHMMPGMDGIETLHEIKKQGDKGMNGGTPIYVLTANALDNAEKVYLNEGFDGFLAKPVDFDRVKEILRGE